MNHHQNFLYRCFLLSLVMSMFMASLTAQDITINLTPTCPGANEGSIQATVVTEDYAPPFSFTWTDEEGNLLPASQIEQDPIEGTSTVTGLAAGSYCVVVTSADGCNASGCNLVVEELPGPVISADDIETTCICAPASPGTIDISLDPAGGPYEYKWQGPNGYNSQQEDPDDIIKPGWYYLTVSNNYGCTATLPVQMHNCPQIEEMPPYIKKVVVKADLGGGNGPVIYQGEWVVNGDCIAFEGGSIPFSAVPVGQVGLKIYAVTNEEVYPLTITLPGTGYSNVVGNSSNGLNWEFTIPPGTLSNLSGVVPALQQILFKGKDADGHDLMDLRGMSNELSSCVQLPGLIDCGSWAGGYQSGFDDVHIFEVGCLILTLDVPSPAGTNGYVTLTIQGGSPPYNFFWQNPGGIIMSGTWYGNVLQLPYSSPGTYIAKVTSGSGCTSSKNVTIPSCPIPFETEVVYQEPACPGVSNGKIYIKAVVPPNTPVISNPQFSFNWSAGSSYSNGPNSCIENIANNTQYCVTVTELTCGSTQVRCLSIDYAPQLSVYSKSIKPACGSISTGRIQLLLVVGGKQPYSYKWSVPGETSAILNNVPAGNYCVTITDACETTHTECYDVPPYDENNVITVEKTIIRACNNGLPTGAIMLDVTGTAPPFSYLWSTGSTQSFIDGVTAGTYSVSVTDACGKTVVKSYNVVQYNGPAISLADSGPDCSPSPGQGFLDISVSGGYGVYTDYNFHWSGGQTTEDIYDLYSGNYTVTVTDGRNCPASATFNVQFDGFHIAGYTLTPDACGQGIGAITITAVSNPLNVSYNLAWSNGSTGTSIQNLYAGSYSVTATNANGCTSIQTYTVQNGRPFIQLVSLTHPNSGASNGAIDISVSGGVTPYTFSWMTTSGSGWPGATTEDVSGLLPGHYIVVVTDAAGCTVNANYFLNTTNPILVNVNPLIGNGITPCFQTSNGITLQQGAIDLNVSGGCSSLTYSWAGPPGFVPPTNNPQDLTGLTLQGEYCVTVSDVCGASATECVILTCDCEQTPIVQFNFSNPCLENGIGNDGTADIFVIGMWWPEYSNIPLEYLIPQLFHIKFFKEGDVTPFATGVIEGSIYNSWDVLSGTDKVEVGAGKFRVEVTNEFGCIEVSEYEFHKPEGCKEFVFPHGVSLSSVYEGILETTPNDKVLLNCLTSENFCGISPNGEPLGLSNFDIFEFFPCNPSDPCNSGGVLQCPLFCGVGGPASYTVPPGIGGQLVQVTSNTCGCIFPAGSINHPDFKGLYLPVYGELSNCDHPEPAGEEYTLFCGGDFEPPLFECPEECHHCRTFYDKEHCQIEVQCFDQSGTLLPESTQVMDDYSLCRSASSCPWFSMDIYLQCNQNECNELFYLGNISESETNSLSGEGLFTWLMNAGVENPESMVNCDAVDESNSECIFFPQNVCSINDIPACDCEYINPFGGGNTGIISRSADTSKKPDPSPYYAGDFSSSVYPNPFTHSITIKVNMRATGTIEARLYDVFGREVTNRTFSGRSGGNQFVLDTGETAGSSKLYYLRISDQHGNSESHKLVKAGW